MVPGLSAPLQPTPFCAVGSLCSSLCRKVSLPLVFLTAFSCLVVQFRGPGLVVAKEARMPCSSLGLVPEGNSTPDAPHSPACSPGRPQPCDKDVFV